MSDPFLTQADQAPNYVDDAEEHSPLKLISSSKSYKEKNDVITTHSVKISWT